MLGPNPIMTNGLKIGEKESQTRGESCDKGGRGWNDDVSISQGLQTTIRR